MWQESAENARLGDLASHAHHRADQVPIQRITARDFLGRMLQRTRLLRDCLLVGLLIGGLGAGFARTYYTAETLLLVLIGPELAATQGATAGDGTPISIDGLKVVQSELRILQSSEIARAVVGDVGMLTLYPRLSKPRLFGLIPPLREADRLDAALQAFRSDLHVEIEPGSDVIRLDFTHPRRDIALRSIEAVVRAYRTERRGIYSTATDSSFLNKQIDSYKHEIAVLDTEINRVRTHYEVLDLAQDTVLATNRLESILQRQNLARERHAALETEIKAIKANIAAQPATIVAARDTTSSSASEGGRTLLAQLQEERAHLNASYGPNYPQAREIDQKIAAVRDQLGHGGPSVVVSERTTPNPAIQALGDRLTGLNVERESLGQQIVALDDEAKVATVRVQSLRDADGQLHRLVTARDVAEGTYRQLSTREPTAIFRDYILADPDANIRVIQPANAPTIGRTLAVSYLAGGAFAGLLVGIGASVIGALNQQSYRTARDAEIDLGLPCLAEFSRKQPRDPRAISMLGAVVRDTTVDGHELKSVLAAGTAEEEREAIVVRELAGEMAQEQEMRVLILDLQGDGQGYARSFGRETTVTDQMSFVATGVAHLYVSVNAPGIIFGNRHVSNIQAREVLRTLQSQFDLVIIAAPSEPSNRLTRCFASAVDANVVFVEAERTAGVVAAGLCDTILSTGGNMLGFVFVGRTVTPSRWLSRQVLA